MNTASQESRKRVLLLVSPSSYRTHAFRSAAARLNLEVIEGIDLPEALAREWKVPLGLDFSRPEHAASELVDFVRDHPVDAIISVDDRATVLAALASARLGLPHNSPEAAVASRDKLPMRELLAAHGVPVPRFQRFSAAIDPAAISQGIDYPCVVKPTLLSGSRGVIRADNPEDFIAAFERTRAIISSNGFVLEQADILVERFVPGFEVALEGLLTNGSLHVLALFDKPDPLDGPFFEETIYVTPSRLSEETQRAIAACTASGAAALGMREGPVHAELRVNEEGPWMIEMASRSIGGLCSSVLEFGTGITLEELILQHAVGGEIGAVGRADQAAGVMMIPIPGAGLLREVDGVEEAAAVPGVTGVEITAKINHRLVPLPEGESYLGFIFARGETPEYVEAAIREAHRRLHVRLAPEIPLLVIPAARHG
ncbi:ATP-grasp domain-containing protein [Nitrolancea hollandica]|uniref:Phosphoribosylglycinamide synthetase n=1 Tax=Nitrolancea hollandica Lb TaxID=1129897 RepID=I4EE36_9BACT|nr:ATP-grasp domain-containing protein [Nitrolancea hollandica]CCF82948.1 Phosphoribosylglycinamide synthetase [Nitrolancea hollandica Lb]